MDFVTDVLFEGVCSPDLCCGRFYPERQKIRNLITYIKMETWFPKIDQAFCIVLERSQNLFHTKVGRFIQI